MFERKMHAVVTAIIDRCFGGVHDIDADYARGQHRAQVMRDKTIAAANIQNFRAEWNHARNFQSHVVGAADFASPPLARPAPLQRIDEWTANGGRRGIDFSL